MVLLVVMPFIVMSLQFYLEFLVYKQLDVFVSRQAHRYLIDYIPKRALNGVLVSVLLETIVPILLRGR